MEVAAGQADAVVALLNAAGPWSSVEVVTDLAGRERFIIART